MAKDERDEDSDAGAGADADASEASARYADDGGEGGGAADSDEDGGADAREDARATDGDVEPIEGEDRDRVGARDSDDTSSAGDPPAEPKRRAGLSWWWLLPAAMLIEFYVYGRNGYIDVCVGKEGHTDFSLVGQPRTDENRWKFPRCERRTNLGLRSTYGDKLHDAVKVACRQATLFRFQGEAAACEASDKGWKHQVETSFCPPWDPNYYQHLFWFLQ